MPWPAKSIFKIRNVCSGFPCEKLLQNNNNTKLLSTEDKIKPMLTSLSKREQYSSFEQLLQKGREEIRSLLKPMENEIVLKITKWRDDVVHRAKQAPEDDILPFLLEKFNANVDAILGDVKSDLTRYFVDASESHCNSVNSEKLEDLYSCLLLDAQNVDRHWKLHLYHNVINEYLTVVNQQLESLGL